jgi:hypothetical protein
MQSQPPLKAVELTYPERVDVLESAVKQLSIVALDLLRTNYQLCNLVGDLQPGSNVKQRMAQLKSHSKAIQDLIVQFEIKDIPF